MLIIGMEFKNFINIHNGETISVLGLGESIQNFLAKENKDTTIGVNDVAKYYSPNYLVCLDMPQSFAMERWQTIAKTNTTCVFSHRVLPVNSPLCLVGFRERKDYYLNDCGRLNKSIISPFVACVIAYYMGAKRIEVYGMDLNTHHAKHHVNRITEDFKGLNKSMIKAGVELVQTNPKSLIQW